MLLVRAFRVFRGLAFSTGAFKGHPPEPLAAGGQSDQRILQSRCENQALQPFCPKQPARKLCVAVPGDFWSGIVPVNFIAAPGNERGDGQFRRLKGHGHAVAGHGRNHGDGIAHANFVAFGGALRLKGKSGDGAKGVFVKLRRGKPLTQQRTGLAAQQISRFDAKRLFPDADDGKCRRRLLRHR